MKKIRKISSNPLLLVLLVATFLFASCSNDTGSSELTKSTSENNAKISGEELFKSIVFADGVLTDKIPSLKSISNVNTLKKSELIKFRAIENEAIAYLKKKDANYFKNF
ncbi:hypothetical protein [Flavobacterium sp. ZB4R12]|uniref:hypothetical protein n=1 Tax=Flavobacterium sp. ZB4R12 TaxID=3398732 RepID=UPI003AAD7139